MMSHGEGGPVARDWEWGQGGFPISLPKLTVVVSSPTPQGAIALQGAGVAVAGGSEEPVFVGADLEGGVGGGDAFASELPISVASPASQGAVKGNTAGVVGAGGDLSGAVMDRIGAVRRGGRAARSKLSELI